MSAETPDVALTEAERKTLTAGFAAGWAAPLDEDDANFVRTDPDAMQIARQYADLIAPDVARIKADAHAAGIAAERERVLGLLDDTVLNDHRLSVWRSFINENAIYHCCGEDFGNATRKGKRGDNQRAWEAWAAHALAALRDLIGGES